MSRILTSILLLLAPLAAQDGPAPGTLRVARKEAITAPAAPRLELPIDPVWVRDAQGFPVVSEAGFVQVRPRGGPGFYTSYILKHDEAGKPIAQIGGADSGSPKALWGDVESLRAVGRVVRQRYVDHPEGLRLGFGDISSRYAGYPDFNHDLVSDHRTHQTGYNINLLVPCRKRPPVHIHLGRAHGEHFDAVEMRHLTRALIDAGCTGITTNIETRIEPEGHDELPPLGGKWTFDGASGRTKTRMWKNERDFTMYLVTVKAGHGSHLNCYFGRME